MIRDIGSSAISGQARLAAFLPAARKPSPSPSRRAGAARTRGDDRPDGAERWEVLLSRRAAHGREVAYRMTVARAEPAAALLSCADELPKAEACYTAISFPASSRHAGRTYLGKDYLSKDIGL